MKQINTKSALTMRAAEAASPAVRWVRLGVAGVSLAGLAVVTMVRADGPTTAPTVVAPATAAVAPVKTDNSQNTDGNNGGRGRFGRNGRTGGRGNNGGAGTGNNTADPYSILQTRSIFVKGNQDISPETRSARVDTPQPQIFNLPPNLLVFNGVTIVDGKPEAFVEDLRSNVVRMVKVGEPVAGGAVKDITFEELSFLVNGREQRVGLGQDFNGNAAFAPQAALPTTSPVAGAPSGSGQVIGAGASIPGAVPLSNSGISAQDMEARMKARRAQEQQQMGIK